jgi:hypothetical protein
VAVRKIIVDVCDLCGGDDMVETHCMTIDGTSVEAEACVPCWQKVIENLAVFSRVGRRPQPKKVTARKEIVAFPGESWRFTSHALIRLGERHISPCEAALAAEEPEIAHPGRDGRSEVRIKDKVKVVIDVRKRLVLTVSRREEATVNVA